MLNSVYKHQTYKLVQTESILQTTKQINGSYDSLILYFVHAFWRIFVETDYPVVQA